MTENKQAFTGFAGLQQANGEFNQLDFIIRQAVSKLATTTLVLVQAVEETAEGWAVDVQPMVAQVDGAGNAVPHGTVHDLPVWRVQGGTSAVVVVPAVGDIGIAVFASTDISGVKRGKKPTTPGSGRRFDWADGLYLGGVLNALPTQFIRMDDAGITITSGDGLPVTINAPGGVVINAEDSLTVNATTTTWTGDITLSGDLTTGPGSTFNGKSFDTHTHGGVTAGGGTSGPPS